MHKKYIWIIAAIIIVAVVMQGTDVKKESFAGRNDDSDCNSIYSGNVGDGDQCVIYAKNVISTGLGSCLESCGQNLDRSGSDVDNCIVDSPLSHSQTCSEVTNSEFVCRLGCYEQYSSNIVKSTGLTPASTCDNIADINSDCSITLSETIDYAELWIINAGPTLSQVINVAELWIAGGNY